MAISLAHSLRIAFSDTLIGEGRLKRPLVIIHFLLQESAPNAAFRESRELSRLNSWLTH